MTVASRSPRGAPVPWSFVRAAAVPWPSRRAGAVPCRGAPWRFGRGAWRPVVVSLALLAWSASALRAQTRARAAHAAAPALSLSFGYTGDLMGDVAGGLDRGLVYLGAAGAQLTVLPSRLLAWPGSRVFVYVLGTHGGAPSALVGDDQGLSNLQAPGGVRVEEAWVQQSLLHGRLSLLAGRYDLNSEFDRLASAGLFINSSFGISPAFSSSGREGPSIFPRTSLGVRAAFRPRADMVLRAAALDGVPVDRPGGAVRIFAPGDGLLLVGEVSLLNGLSASRGPRDYRFSAGRGHAEPYADKLALGAWYYTARFPDLSTRGPAGGPVLHHGSRGFYLIGDGTLWSSGSGAGSGAGVGSGSGAGAGGAAGPGSGAASRNAAGSAGDAAARRLTAFVQLGLGDGRVDQIGAYLGGGITLSAPLPGRPQDQAGLAVASALNGSHFRRARADRGLATAGAETAIELTYLAQISTWIAVQPDVQYIVHPGGTGSIPDALVLGLQISH